MLSTQTWLLYFKIRACCWISWISQELMLPTCHVLKCHKTFRKCLNRNVLQFMFNNEMNVRCYKIIKTESQTLKHTNTDAFSHCGESAHRICVCVCVCVYINIGPTLVSVVSHSVVKLATIYKGCSDTPTTPSANQRAVTTKSGLHSLHFLLKEWPSSLPACSWNRKVRPLSSLIYCMCCYTEAFCGGYRFWLYVQAILWCVHLIFSENISDLCSSWWLFASVLVLVSFTHFWMYIKYILMYRHSFL